MRRAVFPLLLFLFGFVLGLLCLFPIHTVSPKLDAAPLTASRAGEEPQPASEASTSGLLRAAARAAEALKAEDYETLGELVHPERGVTFTASSTVDPETDQNFTADEIRGLPEDPGQYLWGYEDGRGTPILLTMEEFVRQYIFSVDYTQAPRGGGGPGGAQWKRPGERGPGLSGLPVCGPVLSGAGPGLRGAGLVFPQAGVYPSGGTMAAGGSDPQPVDHLTGGRSGEG